MKRHEADLVVKPGKFKPLDDAQTRQQDVKVGYYLPLPRNVYEVRCAHFVLVVDQYSLDEDTRDYISREILGEEGNNVREAEWRGYVYALESEVSNGDEGNICSGREQNIEFNRQFLIENMRFLMRFLIQDRLPFNYGEIQSTLDVKVSVKTLTLSKASGLGHRFNKIVVLRTLAPTNINDGVQMNPPLLISISSADTRRVLCYPTCPKDYGSQNGINQITLECVASPKLSQSFQPQFRDPEIFSEHEAQQRLID
ncbi:hypothetical protein BJ912DRAFT_1045725 [Pholiota molesta]|nr:hypothetical protein BJ912DRAFT_1045725 [Pholiota molesta]